jgi:glucosamine-6-phosphate isomerase
MKVTVYQDYQELSQKVADFICDFVKRKPDCLLCFAGGDTPCGTYRNLVTAMNLNKVDFKHCRFVGLDEWVGLGESDPGSCRYFLNQELFMPLGISEKNICFFDGKAPNLQAECQKVDRFTAEYGPIDLILLGIGVNGHLGFNEPGTSFNSLSHLVELEEDTRNVGQKYFKETKNLYMGITLGLQQIQESRTAVLVASGAQKSGIIEELIYTEISEKLPASILKLHQHFRAFVDTGAIGKLNLC